jgi:hypothetical protein
LKTTCSTIIRGRVFDSDLVEFGGRGEDFSFTAPDPRTFVGRLPLSNPEALSDLYDLKFEDILDYLDELGRRLDPSTNEHMQLAREMTYRAAPTTPPIIDTMYEQAPDMFRREVVTEIAEKTVGIDYLEGWVEDVLADGTRFAVRAFGARSLHIVAGNTPLVSAISLVRSAITRGDCIIKVPSNDPFTACAFGKTMCEMAPDHPITKHFSVAYWRGGDEEIERQLYRPQCIEKIVAWGGLASMKHVTKYLQPGLELISFDPKRSISIVGTEVFESEETMRDIAARIAIDVGGLNQITCGNARVVYVICGDTDDALAKLNLLGEYTYEAMIKLPESISTTPKSYDRELRSHVEPLRDDDEWFRVVGGDNDEGCIIISQLPEPVSFADRLGDRTANFVPLDGPEGVFAAVDSYTQTVGVFPESLKAELADRLPLFGAQRIVSLGSALHASIAYPHDAFEPTRRMCKWIVNVTVEPGMAHTGFGAAAEPGSTKLRS